MDSNNSNKSDIKNTTENVVDNKELDIKKDNNKDSIVNDFIKSSIIGTIGKSFEEISKNHDFFKETIKEKDQIILNQNKEYIKLQNDTYSYIKSIKTQLVNKVITHKEALLQLEKDIDLIEYEINNKNNDINEGKLVILKIENTINSKITLLEDKTNEYIKEKNKIKELLNTKHLIKDEEIKTYETKINFLNERIILLDNEINNLEITILEHELDLKNKNEQIEPKKEELKELIYKKRVLENNYKILNHAGIDNFLNFDNLSDNIDNSIIDIEVLDKKPEIEFNN